MKRAEITAILAAAGLRPQHHFGQNFMVDPAILQAIAAAGHIQAHDTILEVGPGVGNLTRLLAYAAAAGAVLAVDIDRKLLAAAQRHHRELTNVHWLCADVLAGKHEVNPDVLAHLRTLCSAHPQGAVKLVSNLPYNAASPIIAELLIEVWRGYGSARGCHGSAQFADPCRAPALPPFALLAFTVQLEVAARMAAAPNTKDYGPLGILIQLLADVEILRKIPPGAFWPPPKVHSALVRVTPNREKIARVPDALALQKLLAALFSHRRQKLSNGLKHHLADRYTPDLAQRITAAHIDLTLRPENLTPAQFLILAELIPP